MKLTGAAAIVDMFDADGMLDDPRLAEKVVNKHIVTGLAQSVLLAAKLREDSYDSEAARGYDGSNLEQFYRLELEEACEKAAPPGIGQLIYFILDSHWSEALTWAEAHKAED